jgi:hypothetical protein
MQENSVPTEGAMALDETFVEEIVVELAPQPRCGVVIRMQ